MKVLLAIDGSDIAEKAFECKSVLSMICVIPCLQISVLVVSIYPSGKPLFHEFCF